VARATLVLPRVLHESVGSARIAVEGRTLRDALEDAFRRHPALRHHLIDDQGRLRAHILCFLHGEHQPMKALVKDGDEIEVLQAISGG
jgi:molybdopterin synthase sulfur carrier subunit